MQKIVSREEWLEARKELLGKEKALTRLHDHLAAERRKLPWVKVDKPYVFETETGTASLADLFEGRSQLIIRHFMLGPGWKAGCIGCSFVTDHDQGALVHLTNHDVNFVRVSRAPLPEITAYNRRMGWTGRWVSSYSSFGRGDEGAASSYFYLDLTPKGRQENGPRHNLMDWVKRHDEYEAAAASSCCAAE
jgi:predicted dithiol-disulfide oxidoreductase (DUF899 family)